MLILSQLKNVLVNSDNITAFTVKAESDFDSNRLVEEAYYSVYANKFLLAQYCDRDIALAQLDKIMMSIAVGEKTYQLE